MTFEERKARAEDAGCQLWDDHEFVCAGVEIAHGGIANGGALYKVCTRCGGITYMSTWWLGFKELPTGVEEDAGEC